MPNLAGNIAEHQERGPSPTNTLHSTLHASHPYAIDSKHVHKTYSWLQHLDFDTCSEPQGKYHPNQAEQRIPRPPRPRNLPPMRVPDLRALPRRTRTTDSCRSLSALAGEHAQALWKCCAPLWELPRMPGPNMDSKQLGCYWED